MLAGFDSVANHIAVILPPVLLDLFLWLGPHLSLSNFFKPMVASIPTLAKSFPTTITDVSALQQQVSTAVNQFNLFMALRTFPIGVTSLFSLNNTTQTPTGLPVTWEAGSLLIIAGWVFLLVLLGWLSGSLYYYWISTVTVKPIGTTLWNSVKQSILLSVIWIGVLVVFGTPALLMLSAVTAISPFLGQIMLFLIALLVIWLFMPVFFSAHGIYTLKLDAFRSVLNSMRMMRFTLPTSGLFLLIFVVINQGLNFLWTSPAENSWWTLVGIAGHAFVSTALIAASFIYYRDINAWLAVVFEQLQRQANSAKI